MGATTLATALVTVMAPAMARPQTISFRHRTTSLVMVPTTAVAVSTTLMTVVAAPLVAAPLVVVTLLPMIISLAVGALRVPAFLRSKPLGPSILLSS